MHHPGAEVHGPDLAEDDLHSLCRDIMALCCSYSMFPFIFVESMPSFTHSLIPLFVHFFIPSFIQLFNIQSMVENMSSRRVRYAQLHTMFYEPPMNEHPAMQAYWSHMAAYLLRA